MFGWFKKDPSKRALNPGNPGESTTLRAGFANARESWTDQVDVVKEACQVLKRAGYSVKRLAEGVQETTTGMVFQPRIASFHPTEGRDVDLNTTLEIWHPRMFPNGIFEYQHTRGTSLADAARKGFEQWAELDLPVLMDVFADKPKHSTVLVFKEIRRVLLGPVYHMGQPDAFPSSPVGEEHPPFCNCCMFTKSMDALQTKINSDELCAIRFYAARVVEPVADCRINGEDFDPGKEMLIQYAAGWPDRGGEVRKQYVVMHTIARNA